jgi:hypothetical protein
MLPGTVVVNTVLKMLQDSARANKLPKLSAEDIGANPQHRVPAIIGQNGITVNLTNSSTRYVEQIKFTSYTFEVVYVRRIREIPNDEFEILWTQANEIPDFHDAIGSIIPSWRSLKVTEHLLMENANRFKPKGIYQHLSSQLSPTPLYGSYFGSKDLTPSNKVAGFKTISLFKSPEFYELRNPQLCTTA